MVIHDFQTGVPTPIWMRQFIILAIFSSKNWNLKQRREHISLTCFPSDLSVIKVDPVSFIPYLSLDSVSAGPHLFHPMAPFWTRHHSENPLFFSEQWSWIPVPRGNHLNQECIPVGFVPSSAVAVCWEGGCLLPGGACSQRGLPLGGGIPACTEADPPVDRQTGVKTEPSQLSLRTVTRWYNYFS